jgi:hypothetical protein
MDTVHFVYTVPRGNILRRIVDRVIDRTRIIEPLHRFGKDLLIPWRSPIRAPHSISYNLLSSLKKTSRVKFYSLYEHAVCEMDENDIFIGQPAPDYSTIPCQHLDYDSITFRTLKKFAKNKKFIIMPYTHDPLYVNWWAELLNYTDNLILICGRIWTEKWNDSPFYQYGPKNVLRIDMGINTDDYPRMKTRFNPKGKRKFLYIGHTHWYKNTAQLEKIASNFSNFNGAHIGSGHIKGWKKISEFVDLTPGLIRRLADEFDIFVNTSSADAQATTILEQMCIGTAVACTPETGYDYPSLFRLDKDDTAHNCEVLEAIQNADEQELIDRGEKNRQIASDIHNWDLFCDKVIKFINKK